MDCKWNEIARLPTFLVQALRLKSNDVPRNLRVDSVWPIVDIAQGGWPYAQYEQFSVVQPQNTAGIFSPFKVGAAVDENWVIYSLDFENSNAAVGQEFALLVGPGPSATTYSQRMIYSVLAMNEIQGLNTINSGRFIWLPPGIGAQFLLLNSTGAAEQNFVAGVRALLPPGFMPL